MLGLMPDHEQDFRLRPGVVSAVSKMIDPFAVLPRPVT